MEERAIKHKREPNGSVSNDETRMNVRTAPKIGKKLALSVGKRPRLGKRGEGSEIPFSSYIDHKSLLCPSTCWVMSGGVRVGSIVGSITRDMNDHDVKSR
jgi:hypothetical protein